MAENDPMPSFRDVYSRRTGIAPQQFERVLFSLCLPWWKRPAALLIRRVWPRAFAPDFAVLAESGDAHAVFQVSSIANDLRVRVEEGINPVRNWLGLRISGRRLVELAASYLQSSKNPPLPTSLPS
jgi:hypothetical protein